MTGGPGSGIFADSVREANPWPPATMHTVTTTDAGLEVASLPTYTQTGPVPTLPAPSVTGSVTIDGWSNPEDTAAMFTPVAGCSESRRPLLSIVDSLPLSFLTAYPDPWNATNADIPAPCPAPARVRRGGAIPMPKRTAAPQ